MSAKAEQHWHKSKILKAATRWLAAFQFSSPSINTSAKAACRYHRYHCLRPEAKPTLDGSILRWPAGGAMMVKA
jgi:hypothetical protein